MGERAAKHVRKFLGQRLRALRKQRGLSQAVTAFGYRAFAAKNAIQGLREVRERRLHVVLLDLNMPGLRGQTVLEHLTSSPSSPPIIIVSGNSDEAEARALLDRGAFDY